MPATWPEWNGVLAGAFASLGAWTKNEGALYLVLWAAALLAFNYVVPIGTIAFDSRAVESVVYSMLVFSPIFCAAFT